VATICLTVLVPLLLAQQPAPPPAVAMDAKTHAASVEAWREGRLKRLRSDTGWLTVAGLFWLKPGANGFGSAADNPVRLPAHSAPARAGVLQLRGDQVTVEPAGGVKLTLANEGAPKDQPVGTRVLKPDLPGPPDVLALGDLRFFIIVRDGRIGVRLRDLRSPARAAFKGIEHFPVRPEYRVVARYVPHPAGKSIKVPSVLGGLTSMANPGKVEFQLAGKPMSLDAVLEEPTDTQLFLIFKDQTAGKETYGAGRFVYTDALPADLHKPGEVVIDFNKAYNPPCAFTAHATCPLPPPQNKLKLRIEAGEKRVAGH
jgi:uncharacterized protein (DUF1684 family)